MGANNNLFDQDVKKSFSDFEVAPSPRVWSSIASHLATSTKIRPLIPIWVRVAAGIAIILGTTVTAWLVFDSNKFTGEDTLVTKVESKESENIAATKFQDEIVALTESESMGSIVKQIPLSSRKIQSASVLEEHRSEGRQANQGEPLRKLDFLSSNVFVAPQTLLGIAKPKPSIHHKPSIAEDLLADFLPPKEGTSDVSVGLYFSPHYSYRSVDKSYLSNTPFNDLEKPLLTYSFGAYARFKVVERLGVQIGFEYSSMGQFIDNITPVLHQSHFPSFAVNPVTGIGHPQILLTSFGHIAFTTESLVFADLSGQRVKSNLDFYSSTNLKRMVKDEIGLSQQLTFLDVPVMLDLKLFKFGNTNVSVKGGGGFGYLLQNQVFVGKGAFSSPVGKTQGISRVSFFTMGGLRFDYKISNSFSFSLEPSFRKYLRAMFEESPNFSPALPFRYSISTGVTIDF